MNTNAQRTLLASVALAGLFAVGCTEDHHLRSWDTSNYRINSSPAVNPYGEGTGVTGSSASPYTGGGIFNKREAPAENPLLDRDRTDRSRMYNNTARTYSDSDGRVASPDNSDRNRWNNGTTYYDSEGHVVVPDRTDRSKAYYDSRGRRIYPDFD